VEISKALNVPCGDIIDGDIRQIFNSYGQPYKLLCIKIL
jgi:hypothetical protein